MTFRSLTVVRNISLFCVKLGPHAACYIAVPSLWFCYVLHAMMFRSTHILCIHLYQWTAKNKKIIQNKKIIRPTESSFQGLRDRKQGIFFIGLKGKVKKSEGLKPSRLWDILESLPWGGGEAPPPPPIGLKCFHTPHRHPACSGQNVCNSKVYENQTDENDVDLALPTKEVLLLYSLLQKH